MSDSSPNRVIAGRYAGALFDMAAKALDAVQSDMETLAKLTQESPAFHTLISSPLISRDQAEKAMEAILDKGKANAVTKQFLATLAANRRLELIPAIAAQFAELVAESRGELTAEVESAAPVDAQTQKQVADALAKATGKKVHLRLKENPSLIGGLIVYFEGKRLDLSVAGKLDRLAQSLRAA